MTSGTQKILEVSEDSGEYCSPEQYSKRYVIKSNSERKILGERVSLEHWMEHHNILHN